jgi:hypothetical protein
MAGKITVEQVGADVMRLTGEQSGLHVAYGQHALW